MVLKPGAERAGVMSIEEFEIACGKTLLLLKRRMAGTLLEPRRVPDLITHPEHLCWMLIQAALLHAEGHVDTANRWLGFVQGALSAFGGDLPERTAFSGHPT